MRNKSNVFPQFIQTSFVSLPQSTSPFNPTFLIDLSLFSFREKSFLNSKLSSSLRFQRSSCLKSTLTSPFRSPPCTLKQRWVQQDEDSAWLFFKLVLKTVLSSVVSSIQHTRLMADHAPPFQNSLCVSRGEYE